MGKLTNRKDQSFISREELVEKIEAAESIEQLDKAIQQHILTYVGDDELDKLAYQKRCEIFNR